MFGDQAGGGEHRSSSGAARRRAARRARAAGAPVLVDGDLNLIRRAVRVAKRDCRMNYGPRLMGLICQLGILLLEGDILNHQV